MKAHPCGLGEDQTGDTLGKSNRREGLRRETERGEEEGWGGGMRETENHTQRYREI